MKHIIVIETADGVDGLTPHPIPYWLEEFIQSIVDRTVLDQHGTCVVQTKFNVSSAIAAVHEMYGAPSWNPNDIPSQKEI